MYRVDLDIDREQVKQLKQKALDQDTSVRGLVTEMVVKEIQYQGSQDNKERKCKEDFKN